MLSSLNGTNSLHSNGTAPSDLLCGPVIPASDTNGEKFGDQINGTPHASPVGFASLASDGASNQASVFPATLDLATLNGTNGFQISGEFANARFGFTLASAGDVNGDGFDDLIIGAPDASPNGLYSGATYVVFGKAGGFSANLDVSTLNGTNGFQITGEAVGDKSGFSVNSAGDVNGDGFDDLIIGAAAADPNGSSSGATYVVFGKASGFSSNLDLAALDGTNGFQINGEAAGDFSGISASSAGDINGDGFDDMIVGAFKANPNGTYSGATYVVFGHVGTFSATLDLSALDGTNGFQINGEAAGDQSGFSVNSAGDINGDGFDDMIIGAFRADPNGSASGASYVVFGHAGGFSATLELSTLDGTNGFQISGEAAYAQSGFSVASAGDVNGDGFDDLIIGAWPGMHASPGTSYVVFGQAGGFSANLDLGALDGTNGFKITGSGAYDFSGNNVTSAGDVNGDGFDDVVIGAPGTNASYVVFGQAGGFSATVDLATLDGTNGFRIIGEGLSDYSGSCISAAGDVNGDGFDDLIVGSPYATTTVAIAGATYVVFGGASDEGPLILTGSVAANTLTGGVGNDSLTGLDGNDTLNGGAGADVLAGGAGSDTADFSTSAAGVTVNLTAATNSGGDAEGDTLSGFENLIGSANADSLTGDDNANLLAGTAGIDTLAGGLDNDTYVTDGDDTITEDSSAGTDLVQSSGTLTLGTNLENLTLTGSAAINGTGNTLNNAITGNTGNNVLNGTTGTDTLVGGAGNDTYVTDGGDTITEASNAGTDLVQSSLTLTLGSNLENLTLTGSAAINGTGNTLANLITGNAGNNILTGSTGADTLVGGAGNDTYVTDGIDTLTEASSAGTDLVKTSVTLTLAANLENLTLTGTAAINGTGNTLANSLVGNSGTNSLSGSDGNDTLNGTTGADTLVGGVGNDTYITDGSDTITEDSGAGTDLVQSSVTLTLALNLENLTLSGTAALNGTGNDLNNSLKGNSGANLLDGGAGTDTLAGGTGNDTYVTDGGDTITEASNAGTDLVQSSVTLTLGTNLENLTLTGVGAINGTGNTLANTVTGNAGDNVLTGGTGADTLVGGAGADFFLFITAPGSTNIDRITDFDVTDDTVQLENAIFTGLADGALDASAFASNTTGNADDASDRILYDLTTGNLYFDSDGNGAAAKVQVAQLSPGLALTSADFFIL